MSQAEATQMSPKFFPKSAQLVCRCGEPLSIGFNENWEGSGKDHGSWVKKWVLGHMTCRAGTPLVHGDDAEEVLKTFIEKREAGEL